MSPDSPQPHWKIFEWVASVSPNLEHDPIFVVGYPILKVEKMVEVVGVVGLFI